MSETLPEAFSTLPGFDPAEDYIGPFYYSTEEKGLYAFISEQKHCNAYGIVHGGVLMTFADYALCMAATDNYEIENCVTVTFTSEFVAAAQIGQRIEARTKVVRKTRSMGFVTGEVIAGDEIVLTFSSVVKRLPNEESSA